MKTELDDLAAALHVKTDDLLKESPQLAPCQPAVGIAPRLSGAELVTLAMMQAMLGFTSEARWLRHARAHTRHLFSYLPQQPGCNKRLRKAADLIRRVTRTLAWDTTLWSDDVWVVDSTPVEGEAERPGSQLFKPCGRSSSRSTRPSKANATSNDTAAAPPAAWSSASCSAFSRSPPRSGATTTPVSRSCAH